MAALAFERLAREVSAETAKDIRRLMSGVVDLAFGRNVREHLSMFAVPRGESEAEALRRKAFVVPPFMETRPKERGGRVRCEPLSMFAITRG